MATWRPEDLELESSRPYNGRLLSHHLTIFLVLCARAEGDAEGQGSSSAKLQSSRSSLPYKETIYPYSTNAQSEKTDETIKF